MYIKIQRYEYFLWQFVFLLLLNKINGIHGYWWKIESTTTKPQTSNTSEFVDDCIDGFCAEIKNCQAPNFIQKNATRKCQERINWICCSSVNISSLSNDKKFQTSSSNKDSLNSSTDSTITIKDISSRDDLKSEKSDFAYDSYSYYKRKSYGQPKRKYRDDYPDIVYPTEDDRWNQDYPDYSETTIKPSTHNSVDNFGCKIGKCIKKRNCESRNVVNTPWTSSCARQLGDWTCCRKTYSIPSSSSKTKSTTYSTSKPTRPSYPTKKLNKFTTEEPRTSKQTFDFDDCHVGTCMEKKRCKSKDNTNMALEPNGHCAKLGKDLVCCYEKTKNNMKKTTRLPDERVDSDRRKPLYDEYEKDF